MRHPCSLKHHFKATLVNSLIDDMFILDATIEKSE